jgi:predicted transcriptional regulator
MTHIEKTLASIGLTDKEIAVYLALLRIGQGTGYEVTQESGLKKSTVYFTLEELRKKNLITKVPQTGKVIYRPKSPRDLIHTLHQRVINMEHILPHLLAMTPPMSQKPKMLYFEGVSGFEEALSIFAKINQGKEVVGFFAYHNNPHPEYFQLLANHYSRLFNQGTHVRGVTPNHPSVRAFVGSLSKFAPLCSLKFIPFDRYNPQSSLEVSGSMVAILDADREQNILIDNEVIANMIRCIFELVWVSENNISEGE